MKNDTFLSVKGINDPSLDNKNKIEHSGLTVWEGIDPIISDNRLPRTRYTNENVCY